MCLGCVFDVCSVYISILFEQGVWFNCFHVCLCMSFCHPASQSASQSVSQPVSQSVWTFTIIHTYTSRKITSVACQCACICIYMYTYAIYTICLWLLRMTWTYNNVYIIIYIYIIHIIVCKYIKIHTGITYHMILHLRCMCIDVK